MVAPRSTTAAAFTTFSQPTQRISAKKWQVDILQSSYQQKPCPDEEQLDRLAAETELTRIWVKDWFKRERKRRRLNKAASESLSASPSLPSSVTSPSGHIPPEDSLQHGHLSQTNTLDVHPTTLDLRSPSLTSSPSLGYIPLVFSLSEGGPAYNQLLDRELHESTYPQAIIPDLDTDLYDNSLNALEMDDSTSRAYQSQEQSQPSQSQSPCLQMLSQVTEQLTSEAEEAAALCYAAYSHDYSSFYAGLPAQPSLNDFSAYSLSTMPSQSSAMIVPSIHPPALQNIITSQLISHQQLALSTRSRQPPPPLAVDIKLSDLVNMSKRIAERYEASLKTARIQKETSQVLRVRTRIYEEGQRGGGENKENVAPLSFPYLIPVTNGVGDTKDKGDELITPSGSTGLSPPPVVSELKRVSCEGVTVVGEEIGYPFPAW